MGRTAKPWFYRQTGWWMVWLNGKKEKLAKGRKNKKAAEQRFLELRLEALKNPDPDSQEQTVASVVETYQGFAERRLAKGTIEVRWPYLQSFAERHGWRLISECKPHHMEGWLNEHREWKSDWTKCSAIANVQAAFNWAARAGVIERNPFKGVTHRPGSPRRNMTRKEFAALLRASKGRRTKMRPSPARRFREVLVFLWHTGCRPKEAATLKWCHVDFENSVIILKEHKTASTQRVPRPRIIPIPQVVERMLRVIQKRSEGEHVFLTYRRTPWTRYSLAQRVRRGRRKAGISAEVTLYGTRHAFGTRGIINGCDIKTLSILMGHMTTRMTEHYLHLAGQREHLASAMRLVNGQRRDG